MTRTQQRAIEYYRHRGMGEITSQQITSMVGASLMTTGGVVAAIPGLQLPGAIIAAVGALTSLVGGLFKPDITKIQATNIVNQIEAQTLKPMLASWQALPASQKTVSMQAHYLNIFDQAWNAVRQACSNPALGEAGQACISDRIEGSCHWTVDGQTPGQPPTNCGNWFVWFRYPIANDPNVIPDPVASGGSIFDSGGPSIFDGGSIGSMLTGISPLAVVLAAIGVGLILVSD